MRNQGIATQFEKCLPSNLLMNPQYLLFAKTSYVLTLIITNLSIALLQLRISGGVFIVFNRLHYTSIAINVVIGLYEFFRVLFQCFPVGDLLFH